MAPAVEAGVLDLDTGRIRPRSCSCRSCTTAEAAVDALLADDASRPSTMTMLGHVVAFRHALWHAFTLSCARPFTDLHEEAMTATSIEGLRLVDELGGPLAGAVRRATLRDFGAATGSWPFCAVGEHPMSCGCADAPERPA
jgi:hypothetical protein